MGLTSSQSTLKWMVSPRMLPQTTAYLLQSQSTLKWMVSPRIHFKKIKTFNHGRSPRLNGWSLLDPKGRRWRFFTKSQSTLKWMVSPSYQADTTYLPVVVAVHA